MKRDGILILLVIGIVLWGKWLPGRISDGGGSDSPVRVGIVRFDAMIGDWRAWQEARGRIEEQVGSLRERLAGERETLVGRMEDVRNRMGALQAESDPWKEHARELLRLQDELEGFQGTYEREFQGIVAGALGPLREQATREAKRLREELDLDLILYDGYYRGESMLNRLVPAVRDEVDLTDELLRRLNEGG